ncbi:hypothetical protein GQ457_13G007020 [Hibiscus cannabinus]
MAAFNVPIIQFQFCYINFTKTLLDQQVHPRRGKKKQPQKKQMEKEQKPCHLVLVMAPFQGHITPVLQLATALHSKGFSITILHPELNSPDPSNHPDFAFVSIPDKFTPPRHLDRDVAGLTLSLNKSCAAPLRQCIEQMVRCGDRITAVLYDSLMFCAQTVVDELRLTGISIRTSSATTLLLLPLFPQLEEKDFISQIDAPELQALQLPRLRALLLQYPTGAMTEMRAAFTNAVRSSSAIIANSMAFLEQAALSNEKAANCLLEYGSSSCSFNELTKQISSFS